MADPLCVVCGDPCPGAARPLPQPVAPVVLACGHIVCLKCDAKIVATQQKHEGRVMHDFEMKCPAKGCGSLYFVNELLEQTVKENEGDVFGFGGGLVHPLESFFPVPEGIPDPDDPKVKWPSQEHYMQTQKLVKDVVENQVALEAILNAKTPHAAHIAGWSSRELVIRPDWEQVKVEVLKKIMLQKAKACPTVLEELVKSGSKPIVSLGTDFYWDATAMMGPWQGRNNVGEAWMAVRVALKEEGLIK